VENEQIFFNFSKEFNMLAAVAENSELKGRERAKARTRELLIKATIKSIAKRGLSAITMADVTREAGLSLGIVNLHFKTKDGLLIETLEFLAEDYKTAWDKALQKSGTEPADQLAALVEVDFSRAVFDRNKIAVWFAFWGEAKSRPTYMKICEQLDEEYHRLLRKLCASIVTAGDYANIDAEIVATTLSALTDGLWLDYLLTPAAIDAQRAREICMAYLASVFPKHFENDV